MDRMCHAPSENPITRRVKKSKFFSETKTNRTILLTEWEILIA